MIKKLRKFTIFTILFDSVKAFGQSESMTFAASIAFYTIFSMPALLVIVLNIGATFYSRGEVRDELLAQISDLSGMEMANMLDEIIYNAALDVDGFWARTIAIGVLVFSATTVFVSLQNSINHIWHIKPKPEKGLIKFVVNRLLSFSMVASIGFVLLISLVIDTAIVIFFNELSMLFEGLSSYLAAITNFIITQAMMVLIFGLMYKILPDAQVKWRSVWLGAFCTMLLFALGKYLIGFYLGNSDIGSAYGAAGSLVIFLVWVYYSVIIFLYGAQVTFYIAENTGRGIKPVKNAVKIQVKEIEDTEDIEED
ncbi:YihY/virulence factor BrkB family protein [Echinicola vietnamensis]|uniref:Putative membrane protein n=1 Tax=Echinicola vietnamensis (strain DSM 17526 / LMG 23754 / KMM 6221) TaxID=926556 RepID=L0G091_ECHVK|nr:YhjD/YihY/BrkB family envelope integrity protein [Echinicola vietnamensis]AGA79584.1 putative membrane protein [Echinicola vietnamensis DSM 17526]